MGHSHFTEVELGGIVFLHMQITALFSDAHLVTAYSVYFAGSALGVIS